MRYRRLITIGAVVAACGALGAAPALASQPGSAHPAFTAALHPGHAVVVPHIALNGAGCDVQNCNMYDAGGREVSVPGGQYAEFRTPVLGHVTAPPNACWPFSDCHFDTLYANNEVLQFVYQNGGGGCMQTDSVHSGVTEDVCGSHDAGTYWMTLPSSPRGVCQSGGYTTFWLVNVGITNHYDPYPYGYALFNNSNNLLYVQSHRALGDDDQWCMVPG